MTPVGRWTRGLAGRVAAVMSVAALDAPEREVHRLVEALEAAAADAVAVVGGGSVIVAARATALLHAERRPLREVATRRVGERFVSPRLDGTVLQQIVVMTTPTTAASKAGAAVLDGAVLDGADGEHAPTLLIGATGHPSAPLGPGARIDGLPAHRLEASLASVMVGDATNATGSDLLRPPHTVCAKASPPRMAWSIWSCCPTCSRCTNARQRGKRTVMVQR